MEPTNANPVILFDGVCNLCNGAVQFIIKHDKKKEFRFASLQSPEAEALLTSHKLPGNYLDSFILLINGQVYSKSTAALKVAKRLGGIFQLLYGFIILPAFIRDGVYNLIARNRYKWFGRKDQCMIPTRN